MDSLDKLAAEVFAILGEAGIPAEIIGGYALSHYGYVRNTTDIDVVVAGITSRRSSSSRIMGSWRLSGASS